MKKLLIFIILFFVISISRSRALAQDGTPSGSLDVDKIKSLVKENLTATEKTLTAQTKFTGRTGTIKSIGAKSLTLEIDKDITQVNLSTSDIKPSSLIIGNKITILGKLNKDGVIDAYRVTVLTDTKVEDEVTTETLVGQISKIDLKKKTFILTVGKLDVSYTLSKKTTVKLEDFKDGDTLFGISKKYQGKYSLARATKI